MTNVMRVLTFAVCLLMFAGCDRLTSLRTTPADNQRYLTAVAEIGDVRDVVPATGVLIANGSAEIRAQEPGVIAVVYVEEGDRVQAGQVLARLEAPSRGPIRDEAVASGAASSAAVAQARVALRTAEAERSRRKTLVDRGFVSPVALEAADSEVAQARASLNRSLADSRAATARIRLTAAEATSSEIRAPLAGTVVMSLARPGLRVSPQDEQPLFQTANGTDQLTLEILIPEPDMSRVSMESGVAFTVDAYPALRNEATLVSIGQAPLREGRFVSYRALARASNPGRQLLPGMSASVELTRANSRRVLRIPARALFFRPKDYMPPLTASELEQHMKRSGGDMSLVRAGADGAEFGRLLREGKRLIFGLEGGELVRYEVRIGAETDEFVEVTEGLNPGRVIVVSHGGTAQTS